MAVPGAESVALDRAAAFDLELDLVGDAIDPDNLTLDRKFSASVLMLSETLSAADSQADSPPARARLMRARAV